MSAALPVAAPKSADLASIPLVGMDGADYLYVPLMSVLVLAALAAVLRWSTQGRSLRGGSRVADPRQGLLIGVASTTPDEASRIQRLLTDAGVRAASRSVAARRQVLVWPDDVDAALRLVARDRANRG